ncbi:MAG: DUF2341 domain-containing protein [Elusimicrobia bacterium]|nr:DUF2341 domain-containing protein [Elusimicrobiota bacterium]
MRKGFFLFFTLIFFNTFLFAVDWYNQDWQWRREIQIDNTSSTDNLYEYQVYLSTAVLNLAQLIAEGKLQSNFSDVRFTDSDKMTSLDYWLDWDEKGFWVKVSTISAGEVKKIYFYYGNASTTSLSNLQATFSYSEPRVVSYVVSNKTAAGTLKIISLEDNNQVVVGTEQQTLDEQGLWSVSSPGQATAIKAKKLIFADGENDCTDVVVPVSFAGTEFTYECYRNTEYFNIMSPWGDANVTIYDSGTSVWSGVISEGTAQTITKDITSYKTVRIVSDIPVLVHCYSSTYDATPFYPSTSEDLVGIPSNYFEVAAGPSGASVSWKTSTGGSGNTNLSANGSYYVGSLGSQGTAPAYRVRSNEPIGCNQLADSDGGERTIFFPVSILGTKYGANNDVQYIAVACPYSNTTVTVYDSLGNQVDQKIGGSSTDINKLYFGNSSNAKYLDAGWMLTADKPVFVYYENYTGSISDEHNLTSYLQMRQYSYPAPSFLSLGSEVEKDGGPPDAISDLEGSPGSNDGEVYLTWTAPGDDGTQGTATTYYIKYSVNPILTEDDWNNAILFVSTGVSVSGGNPDEITVTGLQRDTTYYFAIKTEDDWGQMSTLSNSASGLAKDGIAPSAIDDLNSQTSGMNEGEVKLTWSAPGDDGDEGKATGYEIKYATFSIDNVSLFTQATLFCKQAPSGEAGVAEEKILTGLTPGVTYYFAIRTRDNRDNYSDVSNCVSASAPQIPSITVVYPSEAGITVGSLGAGTTVSIQWTYSDDNPANDHTFKIYISSDSGTTWQIEDETGLIQNTTFYLWDTRHFKNGDKYRVKIVVEDSDGLFSQDTSDNDFIINNTNESPQVTVLHPNGGESVGGESVPVRWNYSDPNWQDTHTFDIYVSSDSGTTWVQEISGLSDGTTFWSWNTKAKNWPNASTYRVKVVAKDNSTAEGSDISNSDFTLSNLPDTTPPSDITDLVVTLIGGDGIIKLTWTAPGDDGTLYNNTQGHYIVKYSTQGTITDSNWDESYEYIQNWTPQTAGTQETHILEDLAGNVTYYFAIKTEDEVPNTSGISNCDFVFTSGIAPCTITDLSAQTGTEDGSIKLIWTAPGDDGTFGDNSAGHYIVKYSKDGPIDDSNWDESSEYSQNWAPVSHGNKEVHTITGLERDTAYWFAVKTQDDVPNTSEISNIASAIAKDGLAPSKINDLSIQTDGMNEGEVKLLWSAPGDDGTQGQAQIYTIKYANNEISDDADFNSATLYTTLSPSGPYGTGEELVVAGLTPGVTLYFAIKSEDNRSNVSEISNSPSVSVPAKPQISITYPTGSGLSLKTTVQILWDYSDANPSNTHTFDIYISSDSGTTWIEEALSVSTTYYLWDSRKVVNGTKYRIKVTVTDSDGLSASDISDNDFTVNNVNEPPVVNIVFPDGGESVGGTSVPIIWSYTDPNAMDTHTFSIYISSDGGVNFRQEVSSLPDGTTSYSWNTTGWPDGTDYRIKVKATDNGGESGSDVSAENFTVSNVPDNTPPAKISDLSAMSTGNEGEIILTWTAPGDDGTLYCNRTGRYVVKYSTLGPVDESNWSQAIEYAQSWMPVENGQIEEHKLQGLKGNTTYYFAVKTRDEAGNYSQVSNSTSAYTPGISPASISDLSVSWGGADDRVILKWTASGDDGTVGQAESYIIKYSTSGAINNTNWGEAVEIENSITPGSAGESESFLVSGLLRDTTYWFAIKVLDEVPNESDVSNSVSFLTTDTEKPSSITDLCVITTGQQSGEVKLIWTAPGDDGTRGKAEVYEIKFSQEKIDSISDFFLAQLFAIKTPQEPLNTEAITITGLEPGKVYYFSVATYDNRENMSDISNSACASVPSVPEITVDYPDSAGISLSGEVVVRWSYTDLNTENSHNFQIELSTDAGSTWQVAVSSSLIENTTFYQLDTRQFLNGNYIMKIVVYDSDGLSAWDVSDNSFSINNTNEPPYVTIISPEENETISGNFQIQWSVSDANAHDNHRFYVYYSTGSQDIFISSTTDNYIIWNTTTVADGTNYRIKIKAWDDRFTTDGTAYDFDAGAQTQTISGYFTIKNFNQPPEEFNLISPAPGEVVGSLTPVLKWEVAHDPDPGQYITYTLYIDEDSNFTTPIEISGIVDNYFLVSENYNLKDNTTYYWKVKATDSAEDVMSTMSTQTTWYFVISDTNPVILDVYPEPDERTIVPQIYVKISFSKALDTSTLTSENIQVVDNHNEVIDFDVEFDEIEKTLIIYPATLDPNKVYTITLSTGLKDLTGLHLTSAYTWSFTVMFQSNLTNVITSSYKDAEGTPLVTLVIPAGTFPEDAYIDIKRVYSAESTLVSEADRYINSARSIAKIRDYCFELFASSDGINEINTFNSTMTLTLLYQDSDQDGFVDGSYIREEYLKIFHLNETTRKWDLLENSSYDSEQNQVSVTITSFSMYNLFAYVKPVGILSGAYNYPNPFNPYKESTKITYTLTQDSRVEIRIFTPLGDLVRKFTFAQGADPGGRGTSTGYINEISWDGRNSQGMIVADGIYICEIKAKSGSWEEKQIRKIGVLK